MAANTFEFTRSETCMQSFEAASPSNGVPVDVVITRLDVVSESDCAAAAMLPEADKQRARRFAFAGDRRRFIVARSRLRRLLGARLNLRPQDVELVYGMRGKPALADKTSRATLHFNVAHSGDVTAFAFASCGDVGVDIETVRVMPDAEQIAARFFSRREYASYRALNLCDKSLAFFNCWTRKEAFVKALGDGLYHPLNSFDVSLIPGAPAEIQQLEGFGGESSVWTMHAFTPEPGLVGAVVVGARPDADAAQRIPEQSAVRLSIFS